MFKRIMNKVFSCANDCCIKLYGQDTDSIHSNYDDVGKVSKVYREKYNQGLACKYLCNFHIDFKMGNACEDADI